MALTANARGTAIYNQVALAANFAKLGQPEKDALKQQLIDIFGTADLGYLMANTVVNTSGMSAPPGATVATAGSATAQTGTVTSSTSITGSSTIS